MLPTSSPAALSEHAGLHLAFGVQSLWFLQCLVGMGGLLVCQWGGIPVAEGWTQHPSQEGREGAQCWVMATGNRDQPVSAHGGGWPKLFKCSSDM